MKSNSNHATPIRPSDDIIDQQANSSSYVSNGRTND